MNDPLIRRLSILAIIVILGWTIWLLQPILAPFIAAFILAYLLNPLVEKLMRMGKMPRWVSIGAVFLLMTVLVVAAMWWSWMPLMHKLRWIISPQLANPHGSWAASKPMPHQPQMQMIKCAWC